VRSIEVGSDDDVEIAAGAFVHRAQEARLDPGPLPVLEDADLASTGQG
jgi:hypothetical protein